MPVLGPPLVLWALLVAGRVGLMVWLDDAVVEHWPLQLPILLGGALAILLGMRGHRQAATLTALLGAFATAAPQTALYGGFPTPQAIELALVVYISAHMLRARWTIAFGSLLVAFAVVELAAGEAAALSPRWTPQRWHGAYYGAEALIVGIFISRYRRSELVTSAAAAAADVLRLRDELRAARARDLERSHHQAMIARLAREALAPDAQRVEDGYLTDEQLDVETRSTLAELCSGAARTLSAEGAMLIFPTPAGPWPVVAAFGAPLAGLDRIAQNDSLNLLITTRQPLRAPGIDAQPPELTARGLKISGVVQVVGNGAPIALLMVLQLTEAPPLSPHAGQLVHNVGQLASAVMLNAAVSAALQHKQRQLARAQRMEPIGMLAGGVAHDFNNYMQVVLMYTSALKESLAGRDDDLADLQEIDNAAMCATAVARQILDYGRRREPQRVEVDLNELVATVSQGFRKIIGEHIAVDVQRSPQPATTLLDPDEFSQVLLNLVVNARDAMPQGGALRLRIHTDIGAKQVRLTVKDSGCGMDEPTLARVFEPFFTTKGEDRGTGLGLSMVSQLVRGWGGSVKARSTVNVGTELELTMPLHKPCPERAAPCAAVETAGASAHLQPLILVVEDDPAVRSVVTETLRLRGYRTLEAGDCDEAIRVAAGADVGLLLTDVMLPGMTGVELFSTLRGRSACLKVIYMTGYSAAELARSALTSPMDPTNLLTKPFRPSTLLHQVEHRLMEQGVVH